MIGGGMSGDLQFTFRLPVELAHVVSALALRYEF